jgi:hypothetical protein
MNDQADSIVRLQGVRAIFASPDQMQDAVSTLSVSGFDRADLSLPSRGLIEGTETPESASKPAATLDDARQARTLGVSTAASAAALAAAGITVATGGAAAVRSSPPIARPTGWSSGTVRPTQRAGAWSLRCVPRRKRNERRRKQSCAPQAQATSKRLPSTRIPYRTSVRWLYERRCQQIGFGA